MNLYHSLQNLTNWNDFESSQRNFNKKQQGTRFELLTKELFTWHPLYRGWIQNAWLSTELPIWVQKTLNLKSDIGFDLILEDNEGSLIPVQCKYHSDPNRNVGWKEASTFVGLYNDKKDCQEAFLCSNAFGVSKNFDSLQGKPINRILGSQWLKLDESFFSSIGNNDTKKLDPYIPLKHQEKAIRDAKSYFLKDGNTRGKLIFPCGSGKSLTGFWFTQHLGAQTTLIAVPSLALVKQTLEVYFREITAQNLEVKWLCVCSDHDIGSGVSEVKFSTHDIGIPSTTDSVKIKHWLKRTQEDKRYVFTTYQSGQRLADICKETGTQFDLGIFDEAHKTVGAKDKLFSHLLFHQNIKIERRIFMTATERFYTGSKDDIASMDNEEIYGEVFSKMSFKDAIATKLLTDYKIITIDVAKEEIASFIRKNKLVELNPKYGKEAEARSLASMFALRKAMQKLPIKNAVSFHSSIDKARRAESIQVLLSKEFGFEEIDTFTVNGKDSVGKREKIINEFASSDNALITNARCLTEGVDVPKIDCIVFSDPKRSKVDIVQALGRALRKKQDKEWGYVILPVVYDDKTHEIDNDSFKDILGIVRGLAANDERIIEYFKNAEVDKSSTSNEQNIVESRISERLSDAVIKDLKIRVWEGLSKFEWISYYECKAWIQNIGIKSNNEWRAYIRNNSLPKNIPRTPSKVYNEHWISWGDFLGTGIIAPQYREYLDFIEARTVVRKLGLSNLDEWRDYTQSDVFPGNIPSKPWKTYANSGWKNLGDFIGTNRIGTRELREMADFEKQRKYVHSKNFKSIKEYRAFCSSKEAPPWLPTNPQKVFNGRGWIDFYDWIGKERPVQKWDYGEAKKFVQKQKIYSSSKWISWVKENTDNLPKELPRDVKGYYRGKGWISWSDFLGGSPNFKRKEFLDFEKARKWVQSKKIASQREWQTFAKSENRHPKIPSSPAQYYKDSGWVSWGHWLGTENTSTRNRDYLEFKDALEYARKLNVKSREEWFSINHPKEIPRKPWMVYSEWISLDHWLGKEKT